MSDSNPIKLKILGKEIQVACKPGQQEELHNAARFLDDEMQAIKSRTKSSAPDKIAIITALNLANELLKLRQDARQIAKAEEQIGAMQQQIDEALDI